MGVVTIGLKKMSVAPLAGDGGPGSVFAAFGNISTDSFNFAEGEATVKQVSIEESPDPLAQFETKGVLQFNLNIADADAAMLALLRGGTVTTTGNVKKYEEGEAFSGIERTVKIEPSQGLTFTINRAKMSGLLISGMGKNQELLLQITITALKPTKSGTPTLVTEEAVPAA